MFTWLDPFRQGPWYFRWGFWSLVIFIGTCVFCCVHWDSRFFGNCMENIFVSFPNYLVHEMLGHNTFGKLGYMLPDKIGEWWIFASGNGIETLLPLSLIFACLRIDGGKWLLAPLWYWLGSTLYGAGIYAADARACKLPLTSADMITNYAPGTVKGDWYYILGPLGLLEYDIIIGRILICLGMICLVLAVYSAYYYWQHAGEN